MGLDAIIISESGIEGLTGIIPERLKLDGNQCSIQVVSNYLSNNGRVVPPVEGDGIMTWWSAYKLNGISLYSYLTARNLNVALINKYFPEKDDFRRLLGEEPRAVVISSTFIRSKTSFRKLIDEIRSVAPDIFIIAGGPFVYLSYLVFQRSKEKGYVTDEAKGDYIFFVDDEPAVDCYIVSLLGEEILCEVLKRKKDNRSLDDLPNLAYFDGKKYVFHKRDDDISDAGRIPVNWNSLPEKVFEPKVIPIQASKGCPHKCAFCNFVKDRRMLFVKPVNELMDELKTVSRRGGRYVWFVDDNFRLGSGDLNAVCRRLMEEGLPIQWMTMVRASTLKDVDVALLKASGCIEVQLGLESADPDILKKMDKKADPALYRRVVRKVLEAGINCSCFFIFGFPGETDESALRTRDFMRSIEYPELEGTLMWSPFPFCLQPMSPVYELAMRRQYGLTGHMRQWKHKTMDSEQAMAHVNAVFMELDNSAAVYRGDNLGILHALPPRKRKQFLVNRHRLSKLALERPIEKADVFASFKDIWE